MRGQFGSAVTGPRGRRRPRRRCAPGGRGPRRSRRGPARRSRRWRPRSAPSSLRRSGAACTACHCQPESSRTSSAASRRTSSGSTSPSTTWRRSSRTVVSTSYPVITLRGPCGRLADGVEGPPSLDPATDVRGLLAHPDRAGRLRRRPVLPVHRRQRGPREPRIRPRRGDRVPDPRCTPAAAAPPTSTPARCCLATPAPSSAPATPATPATPTCSTPTTPGAARTCCETCARSTTADPAAQPQDSADGWRAGGVDRKTARRYVAAAEAAGLSREAGLGALTDELIGAVVAAVRSARPDGHGSAWEGALAWAGRSVSRAVDLHGRGGAGDGNRTRVASLEGRAGTVVRASDLEQRQAVGAALAPCRALSSQTLTSRSPRVGQSSVVLAKY